MWFRPQWSRSDHCEGEALAFLGGPGACSPGKFWKSRLSNTRFYTFTARKNRPKNVHSFLRSEENYRRMNNLNALLYRFFVWITACHGRVHEKWPKDTEETWIPTEEQRKQAKSGFKTVFWALTGTNRDESGFLGRRAGRRVSVSKSGLSRRERDGWQVWDNLDMVVHTLSLLAPDVWQLTFKCKDKGLGGRQLCYSFIEYSNIRSFRQDSVRNDLEYSF